MEKSQERQDINAIQDLASRYGAENVPGTALSQLEGLVGVIQIARRQGYEVRGADREISEAVSEILQSIKPHLEAVLGPTIGGLTMTAERQLEEEIAAGTLRMQIIDEMGNDEDSIRATFYKLLQADWAKNMEIDEWMCASDDQRQEVKQYDSWNNGRLEHELMKVRQLRTTFVEQPGTL